MTCVHNACGCDEAGCCLDCPLPQCKFEVRFPSQRVLQRREQIHTMTGAGALPDAIGSALGISRRSVYRLLAKRTT